MLMVIWLSYRLGFSNFFPFSQVMIEKKRKNPVYETVIWSLTYMVKNLIEKKKEKPILWNHDIVTGVQSLKPDWKKMTQFVRLWYGHRRINQNFWAKSRRTYKKDFILTFFFLRSDTRTPSTEISKITFFFLIPFALNSYWKQKIKIKNLAGRRET